jgi:hypothetical protein
VAEAAFGIELRHYRQAAALSLRQLGAKVGYDHSYLSQVERGQRPGSTQLARLCDRALGTGSALVTAYEQARRTTAAAMALHNPALVPAASPAPRQSAPPELAVVRAPAAVPESGPWLPPSLDMLEITRHGLVDSLSQVTVVDEWAAVVTTYARDFSTTAPADLLPELAADLELLRATVGSVPAPAREGLSESAALMSALMARTLACLSRSRAARRWWWTARASADQSGSPDARTLVRSWEAISGVAEHRPLPELLELADEARSIDARPAGAVEALASQAQLLGLLGRAGAARQALRNLRTAAAGLPADVTSDSSLFGWPSYRLHYVESFVCTALAETATAYSAQERALALCPPEFIRERAELELHRACCLVRDGETAAGLATAMRTLVELPDRCHTEFLYDAARRVLCAVRAGDLGRPAVRDYRELLARRPYQRS